MFGGRKLGLLAALFLAAPWSAARAEDLRPGFAMMYNLQFEEAHRFFADWEKRHPEDPMGPVSDAAAYLFSEFDRLHVLQAEFFTDDDGFLAGPKMQADARVKQQFETVLNRCGVLADRALAKSPRDRNALFASVMRYGLRSDYMGLVERKYLASFADMKRARKYAERLLAVDSGYYDAHLAVGLENYMLSLKAAPVRWILRLGGGRVDRTEGLAKLRLTAAKGYYLQPFARLLLAVAALRDKDRGRARQILAGLVAEFPKNRLYAYELARLN
jgi:hypothetical protein